LHGTEEEALTNSDILSRPDLSGLGAVEGDLASSKPVLIAGPTASGKSALALWIAQRFGGVVVNADASQVFACWRVVTARPSCAEEALVPHRLYGHVAYDADYSAGHWLREVQPLLAGPERPIIVGGTGLYFTALTEGLAEIPATPAEIRAQGNGLTLQQMIAALDSDTAARIDLNNRMRVQRAWEVMTATGRPLALWQDETPAPVLPLHEAVPILFDVPKDWLEDRIARRFDLMVQHGALEEVRTMRDRYDPALPACRAIGVPELMDVLEDRATMDDAKARATISTRQFAKRQRTWFRARMKTWHRVGPA
jgi:tRNA dimethylallyltransferase